jgi:glucosamine--fructose-6-phosphate aminotransferase (isomerizing)
MCGIVGVVQGEDTWEPADLDALLAALESAHRSMPDAFGSDDEIAGALNRAAGQIELTHAGLCGVRGVLTIAQRPSVLVGAESLLDEIWSRVGALEAELDAGGIAPRDVETLNRSIVRLKDAAWKIRRDCLRIANVALDLAGRDATPHAVALFGQIEIALSAIDRLEVRGRDSAGIAVLVRGHGLDLSAPSVRALLNERTSDALLRSGSVREGAGNLCFVYKAAAEVGELGDNTRAIRDVMRADGLLHQALGSDDARIIVLGHTRWASVGMISEPNAHPLASDGEDESFVFAVLNGDIDNHADITAAEDLDIAPEITTDTKIIPMLVARRMREGASLEDAFRRTVAGFEGSVAIAVASLAQPDRILLALRGSGQALYVGISDGGYLVASEPYGIVEQAGAYVRMDGESPANPADPSTRGQIVTVREARGPDPHTEGIRRIAYDGTVLPVGEDDLRAAEITTRDVDRGTYPHFLLKELHESPRSFRQTLRGRLLEEDGRLYVALGPRALSDDLRDRLGDGRIRRIAVIGQGTAAIAGQALGATLTDALDPAPITVDAQAATELSGFGLREDMSDTLVIAISQSGTTADTNRTVDVARARGAHVVAIVNRRNSDLTDRRRPSTRKWPPASCCPLRSPTPCPVRPASIRGLCAHCGPSPTRWIRSSPSGRRSRRSRTGRSRSAAIGRSSATGRTASPPRSCASSCPSSATSRSRRTSPRTRSTSTSPPSRSSSCARRACGAPTPKTSRRRSCTSARTRRRRS